jgi:predicted methyltransferase
MSRLTELAHDAVRAVLRPGEMAVDATAGNGHDTLFLARQVGPDGRVFAFDVQATALNRTADLLANTGLWHVALFERDHAELATALPADRRGRVGAVMFNLGYLPGGDKTIATRPESTLRAIASALPLLRPGGVLTIVAYAGHPGGADEAAAVRQFLQALQPPRYALSESPSENATGPTLFVIRTNADPA